MRISIILFSTTLLKVLLYLLSEHKHKHTKETLKVLLNLIKTWVIFTQQYLPYYI